MFMCPNLETGILLEGIWSKAVHLSRFPTQTFPALGCEEDMRGGGEAWEEELLKGVQADKAVTKDSCKSSTKDL